MADGIYTDSYGISWGAGGTPLFDLSATVGINASAFESGIKSIASSMESLGGDIEGMIEAVEGIADTASRAMDDLATDATDAAAEIQSALGDLTGETDENSEGIAGALETVKNAFSGAAKSTEESAETMKESAEGAGDAADDLEESTEKMEESAEEAASGFDVLKEAASAAWDGIKNIAAAVWEIGTQLVDAASTYEQSMRVYRTAFEGVEDEAAAVLEELADETGLYEGIIRDSISRIQTQFRAAGYGQADALEMSRRAMMLAADAAAHYGISMDDATSRVLSFLRGNFEGGEIIGLSYSAATRDAYVQDKYGKAWKDLDEATRQSVLLEMAEGAYANAGVTGASGRMSDSFNFAWSNLMAQWNDIMGKLGTPIMEAVADVLAELAATMETPEMQKAIEDFADTIGVLVDAIANLVVGVIQYLGTPAGQAAVQTIMWMLTEFLQLFGLIPNEITETVTDTDLEDSYSGVPIDRESGVTNAIAEAALAAQSEAVWNALMAGKAWAFSGDDDDYMLAFADALEALEEVSPDLVKVLENIDADSQFWNLITEAGGQITQIDVQKYFRDMTTTFENTLLNLPENISSALSGITVQMDGRTVGHLVAPTVLSDMARNSKFGQYTTT